MLDWGRKHTCKFCEFQWNYDHPCDYSCPYQKCPACDYCQDTFAMSEGTIRLAKETAEGRRDREKLLRGSGSKHGLNVVSGSTTPGATPEHLKTDFPATEAGSLRWSKWRSEPFVSDHLKT
jgi:hypothetical protein